MLTNIVLLLLLAIVAEAITEIVTTSNLFFPLRSWAVKSNQFVGSLITCGHCFSVWVSAVLAFVAPEIITNIFFNYIISVFLIHRFSNILHDIIGWFSRHQFISILAFKKGMVDEEGNGSSGNAEAESETSKN